MDWRGFDCARQSFSKFKSAVDFGLISNKSLIPLRTQDGRLLGYSVSRPVSEKPGKAELDHEHGSGGQLPP